MGKRFFPLDQKLKLRADHWSEGAAQVAARQGLSARSFGAAAEAYVEATGGSMSKSSVERITKGFGAALTEIKAQEAARAIATSEIGESPRERRVPLVAPINGNGNISSDGVMILVREEGWKETKIATVSEVEVLESDNETRRKAQRSGKRANENIVRLKAHSYVAGLWDADTFAQYQYAEGLRRGLDLVDNLSSVNDGAVWIERVTGENFGQALQILDWGHSVQYLWAVGNAIYGEGKPAATQWVNGCQDDLWTGNIDRVVKALQALHLDQGAYSNDVKRTPAYFATNRDRMRYDVFRDQGLPVGSGTVESGAKNVVQLRLKRPGRGWARNHVQSMLAALCELHSDRFAWAWQQAYHPAA